MKSTHFAMKFADHAESYMLKKLAQRVDFATFKHCMECFLKLFQLDED